MNAELNDCFQFFGIVLIWFFVGFNTAFGLIAWMRFKKEEESDAYMKLFIKRARESSPPQDEQP